MTPICVLIHYVKLNAYVSFKLIRVDFPNMAKLYVIYSYYTVYSLSW